MVSSCGGERLVGAVALVLACALGCGEPNPQGSSSCEPGEGSTLAFVLAWIEVGRPLGERVYGLDLDARADACRHPDYPGALFAVDAADNMFGAAMDFVWGNPATHYLYWDAINAGEVTLVLIVEGVQEEREDDCVHVRMARGELLGPELRLDEWDMLVPDQVFRVAADDNTLRSWSGSITGGTLDAVLSPGEFPLYVNERVGPVHLESVRVMFSLSGEPHEGIVGGSLDPEDVSAAMDGCCGTPLIEASIVQILDMDDPRHERAICRRMSAGFHFVAVPATVVEGP